MESWSTHHLSREALKIHDQSTAAELQAYAHKLRSAGYPVVFSLEHLSKITGVSSGMLRATIERKRESANYRMFAVSKRSGGLRFIHAVNGDLQHVQKFVNETILQSCQPHPASYAFHRSGGIRKCAEAHCGAKWLFQFDLADFFYSIKEPHVFKIFKTLGYRDLLAFELARLCTTTRLPKHKQRLLKPKFKEMPFLFGNDARNKLPYQKKPGFLGVLPQGAPSSPMLSNLAAEGLDEALVALALKCGFAYTRYADDITLSAYSLPQDLSVGRIRRLVIDEIRKAGFFENPTKTRIAGPGSKKMVLGLLVDGPKPRLSRETVKRIDRHLYAAKKFGLEETAKHEGFDSAYGFHNHLSGLVRFVRDVDPERWTKFSTRLSHIKIDWA